MNMSQQTSSHLASLQSRPDPAADTLAQYQTLPVAYRQMEEAAYQSGAMGVDGVVGWAASPAPSPDVFHIDLRSRSRNSYLGGKPWATNLCRELCFPLRPLKLLHLPPQPSTIEELLNSMRTNPVGKPKDTHVHVYPTTLSRCSPPSCCDMMCASRILLQGQHLGILFSPLPGILPTPGGRRIWVWPLFIPPSNPRSTLPTSLTPPSTVPLLCNGTVVPNVPPPPLTFWVNPPSAPNPFPNSLMG